MSKGHFGKSHDENQNDYINQYQDDISALDGGQSVQ